MVGGDVCKSILRPSPTHSFAYTGRNESLIHRCHRQPAVSRSRINSWSSRADEEQRRSARASPSLDPFYQSSNNAAALSEARLFSTCFGIIYLFICEYIWTPLIIPWPADHQRLRYFQALNRWCSLAPRDRALLWGVIFPLNSAHLSPKKDRF